MSYYPGRFRGSYADVPPQHLMDELEWLKEGADCNKLKGKPAAPPDVRRLCECIAQLWVARDFGAAADRIAALERDVRDAERVLQAADPQWREHHMYHRLCVN